MMPMKRTHLLIDGFLLLHGASIFRLEVAALVEVTAGVAVTSSSTAITTNTATNTHDTPPKHFHHRMNTRHEVEWRRHDVTMEKEIHPDL